MSYAFAFNFPTVNFDPSVTTHASRSETAGSAVAVGDLITVAVSYLIAGDTTMTVADDLGNTYTEDTTSHIFSSTDNNIGCRLFRCFVTNAGTPTITATAGAAAAYFGVFASAYTGLDSFQTSVADKRTASGTAGTDTLTTNSGTVSTVPAMIWGVAMCANITNGDNITAGTGYTRRHAGLKANGLATFIVTQDGPDSSSGSLSVPFTLAQSGSSYHCTYLAFTESSGDDVSATPDAGTAVISGLAGKMDLGIKPPTTVRGT